MWDTMGNGLAIFTVEKKYKYSMKKNIRKLSKYIYFYLYMKTKKKIQKLPAENVLASYPCLCGVLFGPFTRDHCRDD